MKQSAMTVIAEILPGHQQELENYLAPIGTAIKTTAEINFFEYSQLHYCALFIVPGRSSSSSDSDEAPLLVFEANIDGDAKQFIQDLLQRNPAFVNSVYSHCKNYPGTNAAQSLKYLLKHNYGADAFYVAHPGQSRSVVFEQERLRRQLQTYIDANHTVLCGKQPEEIHADLVKCVGDIDKPKERPFLTRKGKTVFGGLLAAAAILWLAGFFGGLGAWLQFLAFAVVGIVAAFPVILRKKEKSDKQDETPWVPSEQMKALYSIEDRQLQNHLTSVTEIKPGWFRFITLRVVLFGIRLFAKFIATKGNLGDIVTIHFARWVILPGNKRLLFMTNYDGSWEHYLGEFIDHASLGLTAIWSNTQLGLHRGFPDTTWLAKSGGSRDEQRFKTYVRNSQIAELVWYSAYVDLTVKNIANNRDIHEGLFSKTHLATWLKCL